MREAARSLFTHMAVAVRPGHDPGFILSGFLLIISFMSAGLNAMAPGQEPDNIYCKSSIKRLYVWTSSLVQTYRHLIGPPSYETNCFAVCPKSYAQQGKRSDCRIHGGDCESMASPCGAIDFYSFGGGSHAAMAVYCHSSEGTVISRVRVKK